MTRSSEPTGPGPAVAPTSSMPELATRQRLGTASWIPRTLLVLGVLGAIVTGVALQHAGEPAGSCARPAAALIVRFELAFSPAQATKLAGASKVCNRAYFEQSLDRDAAVIVAYAFALSMFALHGARTFRSNKASALGWAVAVSTLLAALLDVAENAALRRVLDDGADGSVRGGGIHLASAVSLAKWSLLVVAVAYGLAGIAVRISRLRPWRTSAPRLPSDDDLPVTDATTVIAPDRLRAITTATPAADSARWWWQTRPPFETAWEIAQTSRPRTTGICLSGGGIRSASFNLGTMQSCDQEGVTKRTTYLASVSGGGYLATARQILAHHDATATSPLAPCSPDEKFVLEHPRYLWDRWRGRDGRMYGWYRVLAGIVFNIAVALAAVYVPTRALGWVVREIGLAGPGAPRQRDQFVAGLGWWPWAAGVVLVIPAAISRLVPPRPTALSRGVRAIGTAFGAAAIVALMVAFSTQGAGRAWALTGGIALLVVLIGAIALDTPGPGPDPAPDTDTGPGPDTAVRRRIGPWLRRSARSLPGAVLAVGTIMLGRWWARTGALRGYADGDDRLVRPFVVAGVLIVGLYFVLMFGVRAFVEDPARVDRRWAIAMVGAAAAVAVGVTFLLWGDTWKIDVPQRWTWLGVTALLGSVLASLDQGMWSPHRFYKQRLMTTFALERVGEEVQRLDPGPLTTLSDYAAPAPGQPELLVCAAVHLPGTTFGRRPAGSFTFNHRFVGGPDVGWVATKELEHIADRSTGSRGPKFLRGLLPRDITIEGAAAISGAAIAAANGYMEFGSANAAFSLANLRLGVWIPNPTRVHEILGRRPAAGGSVTPARVRRISYSVKEVFGQYDPLDRFVYVSDGGHHDNLGLIELLRRRCDEIICFDASGDGDGPVETFQQVRERALGELGVDLVPADSDPETEQRFLDGTSRTMSYLVNYPSLPAPDDAGDDRRAFAAWTGHLVIGRCLAQGDDGTGLDDEGRGEFAADGTQRQWFSRERVIAYRDLGRAVGLEAIAAMEAMCPPRGDGATNQPSE